MIYHTYFWNSVNPKMPTEAPWLPYRHFVGTQFISPGITGCQHDLTGRIDNDPSAPALAAPFSNASGNFSTPHRLRRPVIGRRVVDANSDWPAGHQSVQWRDLIGCARPRESSQSCRSRFRGKMLQSRLLNDLPRCDNSARVDRYPRWLGFYRWAFDEYFRT